MDATHRQRGSLRDLANQIEELGGDPVPHLDAASNPSLDIKDASRCIDAAIAEKTELKGAKRHGF